LHGEPRRRIPIHAASSASCPEGGARRPLGPPRFRSQSCRPEPNSFSYWSGGDP
jgi:hypothetical protein